MPDGAGHSGFDDEALVAALREAVVPLDTVAPDEPRADLDVIGAAIADANVIGMGEASHGTAEFFRFKHRLFRYLVEERGVRMLGIEANFAALLDVNDYVMEGTGTAGAALQQEGVHRPYQSDELTALVEWVRQFNDGRPAADRVRVHGIDIQHPSAAAGRLETYFRSVDPSALADIEGDLGRLVEDGIPNVTDNEALRTHLDARKAAVEGLREALTEDETRYIEASSRAAYERASRLVWALEQGRKQFEAIADGRTDTGANVRIRDAAMAAQAQWLLRHESVDPIALWGHNAHLTRGPFGGGRERHTQGIPSLGMNLARLSGVDYYALGLILGGGTVGSAYVPEQEYRAYEIGEPPSGSIPDLFGRLDASAFFLDTADLPADSMLADWLDSRPRQYDVEGGYRDTPINLVESDLRRQFDGIVFVRETTAAEW